MSTYKIPQSLETHQNPNLTSVKYGRRCFLAGNCIRDSVYAVLIRVY